MGLCRLQTVKNSPNSSKPLVPCCQQLQCRIPLCLGIFEDEEYALSPASMGQTRTGFTYSIPIQYDQLARPITLLDIISNTKDAPLLGAIQIGSYSENLGRWINIYFNRVQIQYFDGL
jgi:hypothetical protein